MLRRLAAALTALLLVPCAALAAPIAVNFEGMAALIEADGTEIVAPGTYDFIFAVGEEGELFCGGSSVDGGYRYVLLDGQGTPLTRQDYDMFSLSDGVIIFTRDGLFGAMNAQGEVLVEAEYTQLVANGEGGFVGLTTDCYDEEADGLYLIDAQGGRTATGVRTTGVLGWYSGGLMPLLSAENNLYGYVDATGQWAVRPQFAYAGALSGGRAVASLSTGYGLIDATGNWVITPKYDEVTYTDDALAFAVISGEEAVGFEPHSCAERFRIDITGMYAAAYDGLVQVYGEDSPSRLYDYDGNLIFEGSSQAMYAAGLNGQYILTDGAWGADACRLIHADGTLSEQAWQSLFALCTVDGVGYYGFMRFDATPTYSQTLEQTQYDWDPESVRYGVVDETGAVTLEPVYEEMYLAAPGRLLVRQAEVCGVIDMEGNWIYQISLAGE